MINEVFSSGGNSNLKISNNHIKKMKENMRKVPIIQIKSEIYHNIEDDEAEKIISKIDNSNNVVGKNNELNINKEDNPSLWKKIIIKIKTLFGIKI